MHLMPWWGLMTMIKNKVLSGWLMAGHHLVKDSKWLLCTAIIRCLNPMEPSKWIVWNKFLTIFSTGATLDHLFILLLSVFSVHVLCPPSCKRKVWQPCIPGVAKDRGWKFHSRSLMKNSDWPNENLSQETIFLATTQHTPTISLSLHFIEARWTLTVWATLVRQVQFFCSYTSHKLSSQKIKAKFSSNIWPFIHFYSSSVQVWVY